MFWQLWVVAGKPIILIRPAATFVADTLQAPRHKIALIMRYRYFPWLLCQRHR